MAELPDGDVHIARRIEQFIVQLKKDGTTAIKKAAAPIIGGINCPIVEPATSTAPACSGLNPVLFISGIVNVPVVTVFAIELPLIIPVNPEATIAALAGPPLYFPSIEKAKLIKYSPAPALSKSEPKSTNKNTNPADTPRGTPKIPSVVRYI